MFKACSRWGAALAALVCISAWGEEGMWRLDDLPSRDLQQKYGFQATREWIEHVRGASVRFSSGGSGSIISSDGLVLTNHHVASDALAQISTPELDYVQTGYYARTPGEEIKAPDLELNVLVSTQDVTARVQAAAKPGMSPAEAFAARRAEIGRIESESQSATGLKSEVTTLYQGGVYELYRYKKYTDVRLVFAPEFAIAFFGGDPDNFEFPRYDLDMAVFRIYENGQPLKTERFLRWSAKGAAEQELVFVTGHPGRTQRMLTMAGLQTARDVRFPLEDLVSSRLEKMLFDYRARGAEQARQAQGYLFGVQNWRKAMLGQWNGLKDSATLAKKQARETELRARVAADAKLAPLGQAWTRIEATQKTFAPIYSAWYQLEYTRAPLMNTVFAVARSLVRAAAEETKPDADRLPEYRAARREALEHELLAETPNYAELEIASLQAAFAILKETLGAQDPRVVTILGGLSPEERATALIQGTRLFDRRERERYLRGGMEAIAISQDPLILFALAVDADARAVRQKVESEVTGPEEEAYAQIAQALFALEGTSSYPDATFTLRLSYGQVKGYVNAPIPHWIKPMTTIGEAFEYELQHGAWPPYQLPTSWRQAKSSLDGATPFNFVSTNDIIGGNSGSPVINRAGELVGLIFDGNVHSLVGSFIYDDTRNRAVSVHSSAMMEALRKVYGASALADQIGR